MKRLTLVPLLALASLSPAFSGTGSLSYGIHGNYASINVPEPLKSAYASGFGGGLHFDIDLKLATIRLNGDYVSFGADHGVYAELLYSSAQADNPDMVISASDIAVDGGRISLLTFGVNAKFNIHNVKVSPYGILGAGTATINIADLSVSYQGAPISIQTDFTNKTKFMANVGAGIDFSLGAIALFVEARQAWIFTGGETSSYIPLTLGLTF